MDYVRYFVSMASLQALTFSASINTAVCSTVNDRTAYPDRFKRRHEDRPSRNNTDIQQFEFAVSSLAERLECLATAFTIIQRVRFLSLLIPRCGVHSLQY